MLRIAYCGYDFYANCLDFLLKQEDVQVLKVFACGTGKEKKESAEIVRMAKEQGIPYTFAPIGQADIDRLFEKKGCDYVLSAAYFYKIPIGDRKGVNIHPTLLPVGRGAWPFPKIILDGYKDSGVTIHKLTDEFDAGDIVLQRSFSINEQETQETLLCKGKILGAELLKEWLEKPEELWEKAIPQGNGRYWKRLSNQDQEIDLFTQPHEINLRLRAFGRMGTFITVGNRKWWLREAFCQGENHQHKIGEILYEDCSALVVTSNSGILYSVNAREILTPALSRRIRSKLKALLKVW